MKISEVQAAFDDLSETTQYESSGSAEDLMGGCLPSALEWWTAGKIISRWAKSKVRRSLGSDYEVSQAVPGGCVVEYRCVRTHDLISNPFFYSIDEPFTVCAVAYLEIVVAIPTVGYWRPRVSACISRDTYAGVKRDLEDFTKWIKSLPNLEKLT